MATHEYLVQALEFDAVRPSSDDSAAQRSWTTTLGVDRDDNLEGRVRKEE